MVLYYVHGFIEFYSIAHLRCVVMRCVAAPVGQRQVEAAHGLGAPTQLMIRQCTYESDKHYNHSCWCEHIELCKALCFQRVKTKRYVYVSAILWSMKQRDNIITDQIKLVRRC